MTSDIPNNLFFQPMMYVVAVVGIGTDLFAAECPRIVLLYGDEDAVRAVSEQLHVLTIETAPHSDCPVVDAAVERGEGTYILRMSSRAEPSYVREVTSVETVAVLIDALLRDMVPEMSDASGSDSDRPNTRSIRSNADSDDAAAPKEIPIVPTSERPAPETARSILTQTVFEGAFALDRTLWFGAKVSAGAALGPVCIGLAFRYSHDNGRIGVSEKYEAKRILLDVAIFVHLSMTFGRVSLFPGVSVGGGYYGIWNKVEETDNEERLGEHGGFCASFFVSLAVRVTKRFYVEVLELSGAFSMPVHRDTYLGEIPGKGFTIEEPRGFVRGGVGIRYSLPFGN